jgi:hypothetical protein
MKGEWDLAITDLEKAAKLNKAGTLHGGLSKRYLELARNRHI